MAITAAETETAEVLEAVQSLESPHRTDEPVATPADTEDDIEDDTEDDIGTTRPGSPRRTPPSSRRPHRSRPLPRPWPPRRPRTRHPRPVSA